MKYMSYMSYMLLHHGSWQSKFKVKKIFLRLKNPYGGFSTNPTSNHITVNIRLCLIAKISRRPSETEKIAHAKISELKTCELNLDHRYHYKLHIVSATADSTYYLTYVLHQHIDTSIQ